MSAEVRAAPAATPRAHDSGEAAREPRNPWVLVLGLALTALVLAAYAATANRTVPFWDAGEFIATSATLGIPHQPSTPLYVLIGRLATLVPLGSIAFRVNMLSAVATALAALFSYLATVRLARRLRPAWPGVNVVAGLAAGALVAFSRTIWANALEAEVYSLSGMMVAISIWGVVRWADRPPASRGIGPLLLIFYLLSLSIGIHLGTYLVLPGLLVLVIRERPPGLLDPRDLVLWLLGLPLGALVLARGAEGIGLGAASEGAGFLAATIVLLAFARDRRLARVLLLLFLLGVSVHLFLPIRAHLDPMINEGEPDSWQRFWDTLTRAQYPAPNVLVRRAPLLYQFNHMFLRYVGEQWPLLSGRLGGLLVLGAAAAGAIAMARRDRNGFAMMLTLALVAGPGMVLYLNFTDHEVRERDYFFTLFFQVIAMLAGVAAGLAAALVAGPRGGRTGPLRFGAAGGLVVLATLVPARAGWFEHDRSRDWIARDYAYNLLAPLPPGAILFTNGDNDTFPLWYLQEVEGTRKDVRVVNLSLLNTPWYIRQLRDYAPQVPIGLDDARIAAMQPMLDPQSGKVLLVKDLAVRHILAENRERQPLYLAVTVPERMGLEPRLTMEGLAHRIYPAPTPVRVDTAACRRNLSEVFTPLRSILDPDGQPDRTVYRDTNETRLVQNYAAIHFYLAVEYDRAGKLTEAVEEAERAQNVSPGFAGNRLFLGILYEKQGKMAKAEVHYRESLAAVGEADPRLTHRLGWVIGEQGRTDEALPILRRAVELGGPTYFDPYASLFEAYLKLGQVRPAVAVLDAWLAAHPGDAEVRRVRDQAARGELGSGAAPAAPAPK